MKKGFLFSSKAQQVENNKNKYRRIETERISLPIPDIPEKYDPIDAKKSTNQGLFGVSTWIYLMLLCNNIAIDCLFKSSGILYTELDKKLQRQQTHQ